MIELNLCQIEKDGNQPTGSIVPRYFEYEEPPVNMVEMFRYSGIPMDVSKRLAAMYDDQNKIQGNADAQLLQNARRAISLIKGQLSFKVGYFAAKLEWDDDGYPILPIAQKSDNLKKNLKNCEAYVMFAATIGSGIDRLIRRYEVSDPALGVMLQGLGAERAESLCNLFCEEVRMKAGMEGYHPHPRFSPGFGDLPITVQKEFLNLLDAGRRMGITLSDSYLMSPSKSVTAIIGLEKNGDNSTAPAED